VVVAKVIVATAATTLAVSCGGDDRAASGPEPEEVSSEIEAGLRTEAAQSGISVPDDLKPNAEQQAAMSDGEVTRSELEERTYAFVACAESEGFEIGEPEWDPSTNTLGYTSGIVGEHPESEEFSKSPFMAPSYLRCYGENLALVQDRWLAQQQPSYEEKVEMARNLLRCFNEATGQNFTTAGQMQAYLKDLVLGGETEGAGVTPIPETPSSGAVAASEECSSKYHVAGVDQAENDRLMKEKLL
jgi:hypothetical protein